MAEDNLNAICQQCGKNFHAKPSHLAGKKFCSRPCADIGRSRAPEITRFWRHVEKGEGCWNWIGCTELEYGSFYRADKSKIHTHRMAWILECGAIPDGKWVLHHCDNRACVRASHLWLGTAQDNIADMVSKGRHLDGRKKAGEKMRGEGHFRAKLTEADVLNIRRSYSKGQVTGTELGRRYGVCQSTIHLIIHRHNWKHVK